MKRLLIIALLFPLLLSAQEKYKLDKQKIIGLTIIGLGGFIDGAVEGFDFQGVVSFERKWCADPYGFFGSLSFEKLQSSPNIYNRTLGTFDFYHIADDLRKVLYIGGGITITLGEKRPAKHYILDFLLSLVISSATKRAGMYWIRN